MTDTTSRPDPAIPGDPEPTTTPRWKRTLQIVGITLALATGLPWLYVAITQNTIDPEDELIDSPFPAAAEEICDAAMADVDAFPPAHESPTVEDRAAVIDESTDRLARMTADLRAAVPDDENAVWINTWIDHYEIHLQDRYDFADRLVEIGPSEEFFESELEGTQISKSIDRYAGINDMESCETPGDV